VIIEKLAKDTARFRRGMVFFQNARTAFKAYLEFLRFQPDETVLLPAFIGWSAREGSGVFDPVAELGLKYAFYAVDNALHIDLVSLEKMFAGRRVKLFVIIHYFGYVDPHYHEAVAIARRYGALVLEDEAHALYTDLVGGTAGRLGDAALFSLHKMLPVNSGGLLCLNGATDCGEVADGDNPGNPLASFDLYAIARKRIENVMILEKLLKGCSDKVVPLRPKLNSGEIPQTYPVLICHVSRDKLYDMMNAAGYGVVTLYHTLIEQISGADYPVSHEVAKHILNLPIHQDVNADDLVAMVQCLFDCIAALEIAGDVNV
jgi:dTDP-4-amino-4,6-dideoxygalactose transaminase